MEKRDIKFIPVWLVIALITGASMGYFLSYTPVSSKNEREDINLNKNLRKLFAENAVWTHNYTVSFISASPDAAENAKRILENNDELGFLITPYYGNSAGSKFSRLLNARADIFSDMVYFARVGNHNNFSAKEKELQKNADEIANFLSDINPKYFKKQEINEVFNKQAYLLIDTIASRIKNDWNKNISDFDEMFDYSAIMADKISEGITKQFPDMF